MQGKKLIKKMSMQMLSSIIGLSMFSECTRDILNHKDKLNVNKYLSTRELIAAFEEFMMSYAKFLKCRNCEKCKKDMSCDCGRLIEMYLSFSESVSNRRSFNFSRSELKLYRSVEERVNEKFAEIGK